LLKLITGSYGGKSTWGFIMDEVAEAGFDMDMSNGWRVRKI
jgi:hypothetical protein